MLSCFPAFPKQLLFPSHLTGPQWLCPRSAPQPWSPAPRRWRNLPGNWCCCSGGTEGKNPWKTHIRKLLYNCGNLRKYIWNKEKQFKQKKQKFLSAQVPSLRSWSWSPALYCGAVACYCKYKPRVKCLAPSVSVCGSPQVWETWQWGLVFKVWLYQSVFSVHSSHSFWEPCGQRELTSLWVNRVCLKWIVRRSCVAGKCCCVAVCNKVSHL